jgi:membrane dipeptidase
VPDDVLTRVRDTNGVVMVTFVPAFVRAACRVWMDELYAMAARLDAEHGSRTDPWRADRDAWLAANPMPACTTADVADHVEHVRDVAGVGHVGLGGDYDGVIVVPQGLPDVSSYPTLLAELRGRGWSDPDLGKLAWGNMMRVLRDTESVARTVRAERGPSVATIDQLDRR